MAKRGIAIGALLAIFIAVPALGQSAGPAPVDLDARLKEARTNPQKWEALYKVGKKVDGFCSNCHGEGGNSIKPDVPNLAGQSPYYLLRQLREFSTTQRKSNEFKKRLVNVMTADEKVGMVVFYAGQEVAFKPAADAALARKGAELYTKACVECHEKDGRGTSEYSRIAGQQTGYLTTSLKSYRDGAVPRMDREMVGKLKPMKDADIAALVAYLASMK